MTTDTIPTIAKLTLGPDDVLLVKTGHALSREALQNVRDQVSRAVGSGIRILVLDGAFDVSVLTRPEADKLETSPSEGGHPRELQYGDRD